MAKVEPELMSDEQMDRLRESAELGACIFDRIYAHILAQQQRIAELEGALPKRLTAEEHDQTMAHVADSSLHPAARLLAGMKLLAERTALLAELAEAKAQLAAATEAKQRAEAACAALSDAVKDLVASCEGGDSESAQALTNLWIKTEVMLVGELYFDKLREQERLINDAEKSLAYAIEALNWRLRRNDDPDHHDLVTARTTLASIRAYLGDQSNG